jgi:hypothetical protein
MNRIQKTITAVIGVSALGLLTGATIVLNTYNEPDNTSSGQKVVSTTSTSPTGLLGVMDEKVMLSISASLNAEPELKDDALLYSLVMSIKNSTDETIQFSPSIDIFARDSAGKTHQVTTDNDSPLGAGPFATNEQRSGRIYIKIPKDTKLAGIYYQPNNSSKSFRVAL